MPANCSAGYYAPTLALSTCTACPAGHFAREGAELCSPVPAGWAVSSANSALIPCTAGTYSDWGESSCSQCPSGFLCPPLTTEATPWYNSCPKGSYCVGGAETKCPAGYYGIAERATSLSTGCAACPPGYACPAGAATYELYPCSRGYYCPQAAAAAVPCPPGYYNDRLFGQSRGHCALCPAGHQCAEATADQGEICPEGYYCPRGSMPEEFPCPPGTYGGF